MISGTLSAAFDPTASEVSRMSACLRLDTSPHAVSAVYMTVNRQITHTDQGSNSLLMLRGEYRLRDSSDITRTLPLV